MSKIPFYKEYKKIFVLKIHNKIYKIYKKFVMDKGPHNWGVIAPHFLGEKSLFCQKGNV